jgi:PTS system mannose-specific IIA component
MCALTTAGRHFAAAGHERGLSREGWIWMIGLVLVTHGRLAVEFRAALEHVVGAQTQIETVSIGPDDDVERRRQDILDAVNAVSDGSGVILLTDMFGGTPSNLAISVMDAGKVEVIAGVNLPMLIKLASVRSEKPLGASIQDAQDAGRKYINVASQVLNGK